MAIYAGMFLLFFSASIMEAAGLKKNQVLGLFSALTCLLILFAGLRYHTGADWSGYEKYFDSILTRGNTNNWEYGFVLVNKIVKVVFGNYYVLQFSASCFIGICVHKLYKQYSEYPILTMTLFFFLFFTTIFLTFVRQSIALGIIALGIKYVFDRKFFLFLGVIALASLFHISAIMALPLYFLNRNFGRMVLFIVVFIAQIFYFFPEVIFLFMDKIAPYLPGRLSALVAAYTGSAFAKKSEFGTGLYYLSSVLLVILMLFFIKPRNEKEVFFMNALAVAFLIKGLTNGVNILSRFEPYYMLFGIMAYPCLLSHLLKRIKGISVAFAFCLCLYFTVSPFRLFTSTKIDAISGRPASYKYIPYYNVLSHSQEAEHRKDWNER